MMDDHFKAFFNGMNKAVQVVELWRCNYGIRDFEVSLELRRPYCGAYELSIHGDEFEGNSLMFQGLSDDFPAVTLIGDDGTIMIRPMNKFGVIKLLTMVQARIMEMIIRLTYERVSSGEARDEFKFSTETHYGANRELTSDILGE